MRATSLGRTSGEIYANFSVTIYFFVVNEIDLVIYDIFCCQCFYLNNWLVFYLQSAQQP